MRKILLPILLIFSAYALGGITSYLKLPPYKTVSKFIKISLSKFESPSAEEFNSHFVDPVIEKHTLRYNPIKNRTELNRLINKMKIDVDSFQFGYDYIKILKNFENDGLLAVVYDYKEKIDTAYSYKVRSKNKKTRTAINIIPGSGINQSSSILKYNSTYDNYQSNADDIFSKYGDTYIFIKPNEDILAIHNGSKKINEISFVNHLLNEGASYSAYYIIQSMAISKFLKREYNKLIVSGLSQGGLAALINSIQSEPNLAVIASGFSKLMDMPLRNNHRQIIIPGFHFEFNPKNVRKKIINSKTKYLFTYGLNEGGDYGLDARTFTTKSFFKNVENVEVISHDGGHIYHSETITDFLN